MRPAARAGAIGTEGAFEVTMRAHALDAPAHVREAAKRPLDADAVGGRVAEPRPSG